MKFSKYVKEIPEESKYGGRLSFTYATDFAFGYLDFLELSGFLLVTCWGITSGCTFKFFFEILSLSSLTLLKWIPKLALGALYHLAIHLVAWYSISEKTASIVAPTFVEPLTDFFLFQKPFLLALIGSFSKCAQCYWPAWCATVESVRTD